MNYSHPHFSPALFIIFSGRLKYASLAEKAETLCDGEIGETGRGYYGIWKEKILRWQCDFQKGHFTSVSLSIHLNDDSDSVSLFYIILNLYYVLESLGKSLENRDVYTLS